MEEVKKKDSEGSVEETTETIVEQKKNPVMKNYVPAANERHLIHAEMEIVAYHQATGQKISVPTVQKFNTKEWPQVEKMAPSQGYTITILFDPRKK